MSPRHIAMLAALVLAAALAVFGDKTPGGSGVVEAVERKPAHAAPAVPAAPARTRAASARPAEPAILALIPRSTLIGEDDQGEGSKDVFGRQDWTPPPAPVVLAAAPPPPPPSAPPLPFTYLGKAAANGQWEVYLSRGEQSYIVREKMVIDGIYRVDAIAPPNLTLTYLPLNLVQQLNIGVFD